MRKFITFEFITSIICILAVLLLIFLPWSGEQTKNNVWKWYSYSNEQQILQGIIPAVLIIPEHNHSKRRKYALEARCVNGALITTIKIEQIIGEDETSICEEAFGEEYWK